MSKGRLKYALPRAEDYLRIINKNINYNLRKHAGVKIKQSPLLQRAYTLVNELGVVPYRDYFDTDNVDEDFKVE